MLGMADMAMLNRQVAALVRQGYHVEACTVRLVMQTALGEHTLLVEVDESGEARIVRPERAW